MTLLTSYKDFSFNLLRLYVNSNNSSKRDCIFFSTTVLMKWVYLYHYLFSACTCEWVMIVVAGWDGCVAGSVRSPHLPPHGAGTRQGGGGVGGENWMQVCLTYTHLLKRDHLSWIPCDWKPLSVLLRAKFFLYSSINLFSFSHLLDSNKFCDHVSTSHF